MKKILLLATLLYSLSIQASDLPEDTTVWGVGVPTPQASSMIEGTPGTFGYTKKLVVREYGNNAVHKTVIDFLGVPTVLTNNAGVALYGGIGIGTTTPIYTFPKGNIQIIGAEIDGYFVTGLNVTNMAFTGVCSLGTVTAGNDATLTSTEANILPSAAFGAASAATFTMRTFTTASVTNIAGKFIYTMPVGTALTGSGIPASTTLSTFVRNLDTGAFTGTISNAATSSINPVTITTNIWQAAALNLMTSAIAPLNGKTTATPVYLNFAVAPDAGNSTGTGSFYGTVTLVWANVSQ